MSTIEKYLNVTSVLDACVAVSKRAVFGNCVNGKNQTKEIKLMVEEERGEQLCMEPIHNIQYCR
jgi:hypothetical protein